MLLLAVLLAAGPVHAQSPGEIAFWESVRDSRNPAELQAYLDQFPNGTFVVLAKARLAALQKQPAAQQRPPSPSAPERAVAGKPRAPKAADTWTYRLTYPRLRGKWGQADRPPAEHVVRADRVSEQEVVDVLSIDGGSGSNIVHGRGSYLLPEGMSIYAPYLFYFKREASGRLERIEIRDPGCTGRFICTASGRIVGQEELTVAAGRFLATKVVIDQEWRTAAVTAGGGSGGRTLTVWYAPELSRAIKYSSRETVGTNPPIEPNFDLELVSYKLN